jgi:hypothetical protein
MHQIPRRIVSITLACGVCTTVFNVIIVLMILGRRQFSTVAEDRGQVQSPHFLRSLASISTGV